MTILTGTDRSLAQTISPDEGRLTVHCADRPGVVAAIATFLAERSANIIESDQTTTDPDGGPIFLRVVFRKPDLTAVIDQVREEFASTVVAAFEIDEWQITQAALPKRVAVMVSKYDHCLMELLWRWRRGELAVNTGLVISNHADLGPAVRSFGLPFVHIPVTKQNKEAAEAEQVRLLRDNFDVVVMARYMQILSNEFLRDVGCPVINIHHSFLPAFIGASPYAQA
ncbi:MAG: formyltetrahydrofolate deformylase, partial [Propionibacteriaceae bacterium]|nr:formyltetrahydrofolate deformylase [Propionibacteriaceae bacterium]